MGNGQDGGATVSIFQIVDATESEKYWPMGWLSTLAEAGEAVSCGPDDFGNPMGRDETLTIEIRERAAGWAPMQVGQTVLRKTWNREYPEDGDPFWKKAK